MSFTIDVQVHGDLPFLLEAFCDAEPSFYGFKNRSAWRAMAQLACSGDEDLELIICRQDGKTVGFMLNLRRTQVFWARFCRTLGTSELLKKAAAGVGDSLRNLFSSPPTTPELEGQGEIDPEFLALSHKWYMDMPGSQKMIYLYVEPKFRRHQLASLLVEKCLARASAMGYEQVEGQIRFDNLASINVFRKLGFEVRNAGSCYHCVKTLR